MSRTTPKKAKSYHRRKLGFYPNLRLKFRHETLVSTLVSCLNQFNTSLFSTRTKKEASQLLPLTLHRLRQSCKTIWPLSVTKRKLVSGNYEHSSLWQRQSICGTYPHDIHMCSNRRLYKNKGTMIKTKLYTIVLNIKLINWSINVALMATFQAFLYSVLLIFLVWHFIYFLIGTMVKC